MKWIRTERPFALPAYVKEAIDRLDDAGYVAYVVGGSVRDFLLGREVKDHDIATSAGPDALEALFPDSVTVGKAFGVLKIPLRLERGPEFLEIATFREDLEYKDHRHPKGVRFAGPVEDARRRDFTINALYYDPKTARILDTTGGMEDLRARVVRAIGEPRERFREDALRLLRAVRFTTALDFTLAEETADAVRARAKLVNHVSGERIRDELNLILTGPRCTESVELLRSLDLLGYVLPEVESCHRFGHVWSHLLKTLRWLEQHAPGRSAVLAWAALLHDSGKPVVARKSSGHDLTGHEAEAARIARSVGERLRMAREEIDTIVAIVQDQLKFRDVFQMREATLLRFVQQPHFEELLELHRADALATDGNLAFYEFCRHRLEQLRRAHPDGIPRLVDGKDLIQLGLQPGPEFSEILRQIEDLTLEGRLTTKEGALEYVVRHFVK